MLSDFPGMFLEKYLEISYEHTSANADEVMATRSLSTFSSANLFLFTHRDVPINKL